MKKIITLVAVMALALCACFAVACSSSVAGTYKFESMSIVGGGMEVNVKAGEDYMGVTMTADSMILELKEDGTCSMSSAMFGETESETGTWAEVDGKIAITIDGETQNFTKDGSTLTLSMEDEGMSLSYSLKKA